MTIFDLDMRNSLRPNISPIRRKYNPSQDVEFEVVSREELMQLNDAIRQEYEYEEGKRLEGFYTSGFFSGMSPEVIANIVFLPNQKGSPLDFFGNGASKTEMPYFMKDVYRISKGRGISFEDFKGFFPFKITMLESLCDSPNAYDFEMYRRFGILVMNKSEDAVSYNPRRLDMIISKI